MLHFWVNVTSLLVDVMLFSGLCYVFCCGTENDFLVMWPKTGSQLKKSNICHRKCNICLYDSVETMTQTQTQVKDTHVSTVCMYTVLYEFEKS